MSLSLFPSPFLGNQTERPVRISDLAFSSLLLYRNGISLGVTANVVGPEVEFLSGQPLAPTQNLAALDNIFIYGNGTSNPATALIFGPEFLRVMYCQLSPVEDWVLATLVLRQLRVYSEEDMSNVLRLTTGRYGSVNRVFIISGLDKVIVPSFQRIMIEKNPPTEVQEITTSDHMVMLSSTRELSIRLSGIAQSYQLINGVSTTFSM